MISYTILFIRATQELLKAAEKNGDTARTSSIASGTTVAAATAAATGEGYTLHLNLSSCDLRVPQEEDHQTHSETGNQHAHPAISTSSKLTEYKGPECYVKPQTKSNKKIIKNALCYVCLAGEVNLSLKQRAIAVSTYFSE